MLELGVASSHPAGMLRSKEQWQAALQRMLRPENKNVAPYDARLELETPGVIEDYIERIHNAMATLRAQIQEYKPDVLIMLGDDQDEWFGDINPTLAVYTGDEPLWGRVIAWDVPFEQREKVTFPVHSEMARFILKGLIKRGFDAANIIRQEPRGKEAARGVSHMVAHVVPQVDPDLQIPIVPVLINEFYPPLMSAKRCVELGRALADMLKDRPEKIAIYASGGLSHFPGEFNSGWIDKSLDHWIMERLERNDIEGLQGLFTFDADNMHAGTGEVRAWIGVQAAMNRPAKVVDYVPAHGAITGCGFAYWPRVGSEPTNGASAPASVGASA